MNSRTKDKNSIANRVIDTISGIFIPIIQVLMAAALLKGFLVLAVNSGLVAETDGAYRILYAIADGFFYFLPMFLAYTASKKLKADSFTSVLIAAALLYPGITEIFEAGTGLDFFGIRVHPVTYQSGVIPIILAVGLLHFIEQPLERYLPSAVKGFLKPMLSVLIVVPVTFIIFGPFGTLIGDGLARAYAMLYGFSPALAGVIFGLIWQPLVVFGVQWGMVPVIISNISNYGVDTILPMLGPAVMGQAGAAMAVSILTKNKKLKTVAFSSSVTAILGITEPVLYGVTIPLKRPMAAACIAGAIGGGIVGAFHAAAVSFAFPSMVTLVVYFGKGFWAFFFALLLGFVLGFLLTFILRFQDPVDTTEEMLPEV